MTDTATLDDYGTLIAPTTLKIQRVLPGPIDRCWSYLVDSDLRRQWLARGDMDLKPGAPFTLTWRNADFTDSSDARPDTIPDEHSMESRIIACDPPRRLVFAWGEGEVSMELEEKGGKVLLTLVHARVRDHGMLLMVSAGWHMHLDVLVARATGTRHTSFWTGWNRLKAEYATRFPA